MQKQALSKPVYRLPRSTRRSIPIKRIHHNGIFEHNGEFSICCECADTNYAATSEEYQAGVLMGYENAIKSTGQDANMKLVLVNRLVDEAALEQDIFMAKKQDGFDGARREMNHMNKTRALAASNRLIKERYIVLSGRRKTAEAARPWFDRLEQDMAKALTKVGSNCRRVAALDRLRILHRFFRPRDYMNFHLTEDRLRGRGEDPVSHILPDGMAFYDTYMKMDGWYARALVLRDFPALLDDTLIADLTALPKELLVTLDFLVKPKDEGMRLINRYKDGVEHDIGNLTRKAGKEGNWNVDIPLHLREQREACNELYDCINNQDQRVTMIQMTILHTAASREELDADTAAIQSIGNSKSCQIGVLRYRQERALNTALPYGLDFIGAKHMMTSENAAVLVPFSTKELYEKGGFVYGTNEISRRLVVLNRKEYQNGGAFVVGVPGAGKSMLVKEELMNVFLKTRDDMILLDPDGEYRRVVERLHGQLVRVSATSSDHINVMDLSEDFTGEDDPVIIKCEFISGLIGLMMKGAMDGKAQSVTDRCVARVLGFWASAGRKMRRQDVTLKTLYEELLRQKDPEAREVALSMEIFAKGSLSAFSSPTNVDLNNRLVCFDVKDLSKQLRGVGMMVVLDAIDRRVARNRKEGRNTWVWCDEIWTLMRYQLTERYLDEFWRRCRKYGGIPTGITQNISEVLDSELASRMLANSQFVFMLNQHPEERRRLAELFRISPDQEAYLENARAGHGLLRAGAGIIPVNAEFDTKSKLYRVMTTKLSEVKQYGQ